CTSLVTSDQCHPAKKPMMIGEWASKEYGDGGTKKAEWITDAHLVQLPKNYPGIKAVVWFNWHFGVNAENIIESTPTALAGFKTAIASPYFASNQFANL